MTLFLVSPAFFSAKRLGEREAIYCRMNLGALVHAALGSLICLSILWTNSSRIIHNNLPEPTPLLLVLPKSDTFVFQVDLALGIAIGYFLYDLGVVLYYYSKLPQTPTVVHHVVVLIGCFWVSFSRHGISFAILAMIQDISTIFLYLRFFMNIFQIPKDSYIYKTNQVFLYSTYICFRFFWNAGLGVYFWFSQEHLHIDFFLSAFATTFFVVIGCLNTLWLIRLCSNEDLFRGIVEDFFTPIPSGKSPATQRRISD